MILRHQATATKKTDKKRKAEGRPVGRCKAKVLEGRDIASKKPRLTEKTEGAQKRRNKIRQTQHEMGLYTCKVDEFDTQALFCAALMRGKALLRALSEADETKKNQIQ